MTLRTSVDRRIEPIGLQPLDAAGLGGTARIVEQAIDAAEFLDREADQRAHLVLDRDIGLTEDAGRAEFFGERVALRRAAAGDYDLCTLGHEYFGGSLPDAAGRAGNHRNLAVKPSHVMLPVLAAPLFQTSGACGNKASNALPRRLEDNEALETFRPPITLFALCSALFWIG
jgi:hypothetical protein